LALGKQSVFAVAITGIYALEYNTGKVSHIFQNNRVTICDASCYMALDDMDRAYYQFCPDSTCFFVRASAGGVDWNFTVPSMEGFAINTVPIPAKNGSFVIIGANVGSYCRYDEFASNPKWCSKVPWTNTGTLSSDDTSVYFISETILYRLSTSSGTILWKSDFQGRYNAVISESSSIFSPTLLALNKNYATTILVVDSSTAKIMWTSDFKDYYFEDPVWDEKGNVLAIGCDTLVSGIYAVFSFGNLGGLNWKTDLNISYKDYRSSAMSFVVYPSTSSSSSGKIIITAPHQRVQLNQVFCLDSGSGAVISTQTFYELKVVAVGSQNGYLVTSYYTYKFGQGSMVNVTKIF